MIEASDLPADHKEMLKTGLAARAVKLGLDGHLGPLFAKFTEPGRRMLADTERTERQAAQPGVVLAGAETTAGQRGLGPQPTEQQPALQMTQVATEALPDIIPEAPAADRRLRDLIRTGVSLLVGAGTATAGLTAAVLAATTGPAGTGTEELRQILDDGREVRLR